MLKKTVALALSAITLVSLAGCGEPGFKRDSSSEYDPEKTYLNVGNFNGGLGYAWLQEVANNYMALHEDVVIKINNDKDGFAENLLAEKMEEYGNDLYFVNGITYANFVGQGLVEDVTDIVKSKVEGENRTIEDKLNESVKKFYQTNDGKYYALPFFDAIFGTVYDVDLFEEKGFYFDKSGNFIGENGALDNLSAGPNGVEGDYDDGLPATISQWKLLLQEISSYSMLPYTWTGEYYYYRYRWLASVWADYEGKEAFDLNLSFDGEYTFPGDTEPTKIDLTNAYRLQEQPGKKFALEMAEYIVRNNYYKKTAFDSVNTHTMAQNDFLLSVESSQLSDDAQRVAMIFEGGW
ncbi:MAG: extracellular solute-binding protein, partial [Clostridia bacterium]|nr:extracellular solute-binding protein [Clostridia bacterium]